MQGLEVCVHPGNVNRSEGDAVEVFDETILELAFLSTIFRVP